MTLIGSEWSNRWPRRESLLSGNKRTVSVRKVLDGLMYLLSTGCQWDVTRKDLLPKSTVRDYFDRWTDDQTLERIHHTLCIKCRELPNRAV
jgi:transposase